MSVCERVCVSMWFDVLAKWYTRGACVYAMCVWEFGCVQAVRCWCKAFAILPSSIHFSIDSAHALYKYMLNEWCESLSREYYIHNQTDRHTRRHTDTHVSSIRRVVCVCIFEMVNEITERSGLCLWWGEAGGGGMDSKEQTGMSYDKIYTIQKQKLHLKCCVCVLLVCSRICTATNQNDSNSYPESYFGRPWGWAAGGLFIFFLCWFWTVCAHGVWGPDGIVRQLCTQRYIFQAPDTAMPWLCVPVLANASVHKWKW